MSHVGGQASEHLEKLKGSTESVGEGTKPKEPVRDTSNEHGVDPATTDQRPAGSVTIYPASHQAKVISYDESKPADHSRAVLRYACPQDQRSCLELLQSSFDANLTPALLPAENGFVNAAIRAYSDHHHLVIRPEDIWVSILTQFSFYVNAHAEELRDKFVSHQGQKALELQYDGCRYSFDFGVFAADMGNKIQENVTDPELREWIIPSFSTTTRHDEVVASIIMMGSMQKYFTYRCLLMCGLPSVTLLGVKSDYQRILRKLEKFQSFGEETTAFYKMMAPVISRFVQSFDDPKSEETIDFWNRIFTRQSMGSGAEQMTGWITAFCFWDSKGERQGNLHRVPHDKVLPEEKVQDKSIYVIDEFREYGDRKYPNYKAKLVIDGQVYPQLDLENGVPAGFCKVPVKVNDNGDEFDAEMIAGNVGINCTSSGGEVEGGDKGLDTMQPQSGWWIYEKISPRGL